jgi:hypothetical protein
MIRALALAAVFALVLVVTHLEFSFSAPGAGLIGLAMIGLALVGVAALAWAIVGRRPRALRLFVVAFGSLILYGAVAMPVTRWQHARSRDRGDRIARAIQVFQDDERRIPGHLADLIPRYLEAIPASAMGLFRAVPFRYLPEGPGGYNLVYPAPGWLLCRRGPDAGWSCDD